MPDPLLVRVFTVAATLLATPLLTLIAVVVVQRVRVERRGA